MSNMALLTRKMVALLHIAAVLLVFSSVVHASHCDYSRLKIKFNLKEPTDFEIALNEKGGKIALNKEGCTQGYSNIIGAGSEGEKLEFYLCSGKGSRGKIRGTFILKPKNGHNIENGFEFYETKEQGRPLCLVNTPFTESTYEIDVESRPQGLAYYPDSKKYINMSFITYTVTSKK